MPTNTYIKCLFWAKIINSKCRASKTVQICYAWYKLSGFVGVIYWSYHILDFEMWLFIWNNIKCDKCWFPTIIHDNLWTKWKRKSLIFWMQIVTKINLPLCSDRLSGLSLIPLCEPNSSVPTWPLHHKPIHVNLTHSADGKRSTLALAGTRDCAIMNTPVLPVPQLRQRVRSLGLFE